MSVFCSTFVPIIEIMNFVANIRSLFPAEAAKQAVENDVHVLGVSSLAAGHKTLLPQVVSSPRRTMTSCTKPVSPPSSAPAPRLPTPLKW